MADPSISQADDQGARIYPKFEPSPPTDFPGRAQRQAKAHIKSTVQQLVTKAQNEATLSGGLGDALSRSAV